MDLKNYCENWYGSLSGKNSLNKLDELCAKAMSEIFGYYALEMGELSARHDLLGKSRIAAGFSLVREKDQRTGDSKNESLIISTTEQLPVATDNVDLVVASHVLEMSENPHQVLREIDRVLVPEGHCILIGFNRFSLLRAGRFFVPGEYRKENPYKMQSANRVRDWFSLLGFEVINVHHFGFRPGIRNLTLFDRLNWLENLGEAAFPVLGNLYMLHTRKQVVAMRPHKKVWKAPAVLSGGKVALNNTAQKIRRENFSNL